VIRNILQVSIAPSFSSCNSRLSDLPKTYLLVTEIDNNKKEPHFANSAWGSYNQHMLGAGLLAYDL
jgi:hypothetical protein